MDGGEGSAAGLLKDAAVAALVDERGDIFKAVDLLLKRFAPGPVVLALAGPQIRSACERYVTQVRSEIKAGRTRAA